MLLYWRKTPQNKKPSFVLPSLLALSSKAIKSKKYLIGTRHNFLTDSYVLMLRVSDIKPTTGFPRSGKVNIGPKREVPQAWLSI